MTEANIMFAVSQDIPRTANVEQQTNLLSTFLKEVVKSNVYSYIVYKKYKNSAFTGWRIKYNISYTDAYNTLKKDDVILEILNIIKNNSSDEVQKVVGYNQPTLSLMLKLFDPIVKKYALEQSNKWNEIEYDDAYAMCQMCMLELYNKGYYINKDLLKKSFRNKVIMSLRPVKDKPFTVSLEDLIVQDEDMSFNDTIADKNSEYAQEDKEEQEEIMATFNKVKAFLITVMGERQFEQLFKEYGSKHTSSWSRKKMQDLKKMLARQGITIKNFK